MRGYWPQQEDDTTGNTEHLNRVAKYVVSTTMTDPEWENSIVLAGPLVEEIEALKAQAGKDIVTTGSITLVHDLISHGLVDEYRPFVFRWCSGGAGGCPRMRPMSLPCGSWSRAPSAPARCCSGTHPHSRACPGSRSVTGRGLRESALGTAGAHRPKLGQGRVPTQSHTPMIPRHEA